MENKIHFEINGNTIAYFHCYMVSVQKMEHEKKTFLSELFSGQVSDITTKTLPISRSAELPAPFFFFYPHGTNNKRKGFPRQQESQKTSHWKTKLPRHPPRPPSGSSSWKKRLLTVKHNKAGQWKKGHQKNMVSTPLKNKLMKY